MRWAWVVLVAGLSTASCKTMSGVLPGNLEGMGRMVDSAGNVLKKIEDANRDLTPENEYFLGRALAAQVLKKHRGKYHNRSEYERKRLAGITEYVTNIGYVLVAAAADSRGDVEDDRPTPIAGWHFVVLRSDTVNAMAAPGGYIFITDAAIVLAESEDEIAAVLAHEIAHVMRGHALRAIKQSNWSALGAEFVTAAASALGPREIAQLTNIFGSSIENMVTTLLESGYSQDLEYEADAVGKQLLRAAGYEKGALSRFISRLPNQEGGGGFTDTHPTPRDRVAKLGRPRAGGNRMRAMRFASAKRRLISSLRKGR